ARARESLERARATAHAIGERMSEGLWTTLLGISAHDDGRLEEAERYHEQAVTMTRATGGESSLAESLGYLGMLRHEQGRMDEARNHYKEALALLNAPTHRSLTALIAGCLGALEAACGRIPDAEAASDLAGRMAEKTFDPDRRTAVA